VRTAEAAVAATAVAAADAAATAEAAVAATGAAAAATGKAERPQTTTARPSLWRAVALLQALVDDPAGHGPGDRDRVPLAFVRPDRGDDRVDQRRDQEHDEQRHGDH
jgi:hypothetical protein